MQLSSPSLTSNTYTFPNATVGYNKRNDVSFTFRNTDTVNATSPLSVTVSPSNLFDYTRGNGSNDFEHANGISRDSTKSFQLRPTT